MEIEVFSPAIQAANLQALGIETVVINGDSLSKASQEKRDLWDEALRLRYQIIIISPELLRSNDSYRLTDNEVFSEHWMYTVFDEAHLADEWAEDFRPDFGNLGLLRPRGGPHVTYVGLTATLEPGRQTNIVLERLGFTKGDYFLDRRDCERTNIDLIIRPLQFPFGGYHLRDLDWLIPENMSSILDIEKCIVFSSSLDFTYRISESLRSLLPDTFQKQRNTIIRQIHSLKCVDCKTETLAALRVPADSPERQMGLTSSTSVLDHGFNAPDIRRMISTGDMPSTAIISQRIGRILRDPRLGRGQGIFYVKPKELAAAQAWADENMTHPCMLHDVVHPEAHRTAVAERTAKATKTKQAQNSSAAIEDEHVSENEMDHDFEDEAAAEDAFWGAGGDNMEVADKDEEAPDAMDVDGNEDGIGGDEMEVDDAALSDAEKEDRFADTLRDLVLQREEEDDSMEEAYRPHRGEKQQADLASKYLFLSAPYRGVCLVRQLNLIYDNPNKTRNCGHCSVCKPDTPPAPRDINREPCKCTVCSSASTSTDDTEDAPKRPSKHNVPKYLAPAIADRLREGLNRTYRGLDLPMKRWFSADAAFPARMLLDLAEDLHLIFTRRDVELRIGRDSPADCTHVQRAWLHWEELGDVLWAELQVVWDVTKTVLEGAHQEKLKKGREKRAERKNEKGNTPAGTCLTFLTVSYSNTIFCRRRSRQCASVTRTACE